MTRKLLPGPPRPTDPERYAGQYVAVLDDGTVVAASPDPDDVFLAVRALGLAGRACHQYLPAPDEVPVTGVGASLEFLPVPE
ncbi:MAG TPA: DUF5678 domain-containing protein [Mycobacteriales bacterium]|jgi:hypothetical protein